MTEVQEYFNRKSEINIAMKNDYFCRIDFSEKQHYTQNTPPEIASPARRPQQCGTAL